MGIPEKLMARHDKSTALEIAHQAVSNPEDFKTLMNCVLSEDKLLVQRGSWAMRWTFEKNPDLFQEYWKPLLEKLNHPLHDALPRNVLKMASELEIIPETIKDELADKCFEFLESRKQPVAIRVFAMDILEKICREYPELDNELALIIEEFMPHESAGFKSKGKKVLQIIKRRRN
jgi:hypothetical protein